MRRLPVLLLAVAGLAVVAPSHLLTFRSLGRDRILSTSGSVRFKITRDGRVASE
jgi:hypothetical protein